MPPHFVKHLCSVASSFGNLTTAMMRVYLVAESIVLLDSKSEGRVKAVGFGSKVRSRRLAEVDESDADGLQAM